MMVYLMKPLKVYAYTSGMGFPGRLIMQITAFFDFYSTFTIGKNEVLRLHQRVFKGNFIFNQGVMKVDYASIEREIQMPSMRRNILLGASVNGLGEAFSMNAPIISLGEPLRTQAREFLDAQVFLPDIMTLSHTAIRAKCAQILQEWVDGEKPADNVMMRSVITRMTIFLLEGVLIPKADSDRITGAYLKSTGLTMLFRYFPFFLGLNQPEKRFKRDVQIPLQKLGVSNPVIDVTLFAAMLGIGSTFIQCVKDIKAHQIDFGQLDAEHKVNLVIEAARREPTVAGTHRIVETPEEIVIAGRKIILEPGELIIYPLVCANTDESVFKCPYLMDLNRSQAEKDKVLSWSKGAHNCPAKDLSIEITVAMLESLQEKVSLDTVRY